MRVRVHSDGLAMAALQPRWDAAPTDWRFHVLCQIDGYGRLRQRLGDEVAAGLPQDVARIAAEETGSKAEVIGRNLVEFAFDGADGTALECRLAEIRSRCEDHFRVRVGATISLVFGTAASPLPDADPVRLAEEAEAALHEARTVGHQVSHDAPVAPRALRSRAAEIERGLEEEQFILLYQPKLHMRRQAVSSVEALIRWHHPDRGLVLPAEFIADAEQSHLIARMTLWAIERAIRDQRTLAEHSHDLVIFVNISGQLLGNAPFVRAACDLVAESDAKLGFEITETSVIRDPASAIANLHLFADVGITIAIDDYGAGLSSLAYLKQLPARELKIDKLFVTQLTSSNRDPLIVRSTIDLAHALEMEVVAEGVETHSALALLTVMGCDMVQGFLVSRPITLDGLLVYLSEDRARFAPEQSRVAVTQLAARWKTA